MRELENLSPLERAVAYRSKAEALAAEVGEASPATAAEFRKLSSQWLLLAQQLESGYDEPLRWPTPKRNRLAAERGVYFSRGSSKRLRAI